MQICFNKKNELVRLDLIFKGCDTLSATAKNQKDVQCNDKVDLIWSGLNMNWPSHISILRYRRPVTPITLAGFQVVNEGLFGKIKKSFVSPKVWLGDLSILGHEDIRVAGRRVIGLSYMAGANKIHSI